MTKKDVENTMEVDDEAYVLLAKSLVSILDLKKKEEDADKRALYSQAMDFVAEAMECLNRVLLIEFPDLEDNAEDPWNNVSGGDSDEAHPKLKKIDDGTPEKTIADEKITAEIRVDGAIVLTVPDDETTRVSSAFADGATCSQEVSETTKLGQEQSDIALEAAECLEILSDIFERAYGENPPKRTRLRLVK